ncbi:hypothetical protein CDEST_15084 [Colletotrichum destructivum]|uniref:Uncharacterized protein n=1 Tax=Colletotrichum destructivum TaxID=34406 RepID=A0AAX4J3P1_9PEZI|nr:hypothetical protein CDEST_15084 [Colletotrichum destructivum]
MNSKSHQQMQFDLDKPCLIPMRTSIFSQDTSTYRYPHLPPKTRQKQCKGGLHFSHKNLIFPDQAYFAA